MSFTALLLGIFSALSILLAAVGVSGVMAYTVAQRTREFGIRMAVGARSFKVLLLVLKDGILLTTLGIVAGIGSSWAIVQLLRNMLYQVNPHGALTFVAVPAFLAAVALASCWLPARGDARVDASAALRHD